METVGKKLVRLDPFSASIVVLAEAVNMHFYTLVSVPVSTSQAASERYCGGEYRQGHQARSVGARWLAYGSAGFLTSMPQADLERTL